MGILWKLRNTETGGVCDSWLVLRCKIQKVRTKRCIRPRVPHLITSYHIDIIWHFSVIKFFGATVGWRESGIVFMKTLESYCSCLICRRFVNQWVKPFGEPFLHRMSKLRPRATGMLRHRVFIEKIVDDFSIISHFSKSSLSGISLQFCAVIVDLKDGDNSYFSHNFSKTIPLKRLDGRF